MMQHIIFKEPEKEEKPANEASAFVHTSPQRPKAKYNFIPIMVILAVILIYGFGAYLIGSFMMKTGSAINMVMVLFAYGLMGAVAILFLHKNYDNTEQSRQLLADILTRSRGGRLITDYKGNISFSNKAFQNFIAGAGANVTASDLGAFIALFEHKDKTEKIMQGLIARAMQGEQASTELAAKNNGKNIWFSITVDAIEGRKGFLYWRIDDITEKHEIENALFEEQNKLKDFTDHAPVGFFSVDEEGRFIFINNTLAHWFGLDSAEIVFKSKLHQFMAPPPSTARPYDCFEDGGTYQNGEILLRGSGGRIFKAAITHSIAKDQDDRIRTRSVVYDLTTEHKMKQALLQSEDRFKRLFDEAPVGICVIDKDGLITECNNTLAVMAHTKIDLIKSQKLTAILSAEDSTRVTDWISRIYARTQAYSYVEVKLIKGQQFKTVQLYARKFQESDQLILHFIDLTEQKTLEQQFTQSQKMQAIGQLAGGIAHDFNNLLTAMIGFCDLLLLRHKPGDPSFNDIMQIKQNSNRAASLVRHLLAFSRQQTLQPRVLDVADILSEISHLMRRLIGAPINLSIDHGQDLGLVKVDQGQMEQVLINLVVNARDAMPSGGDLVIKTYNHVITKSQKLKSGDDILPAGAWVVIKVTDTGTGIPLDILPRIFEPFFTTKEFGAGTGLGLSTVHGIVHQTGGFIDIETSLGKGTSFYLYLPRFAAEGGVTVKDHIQTVEEKNIPSDLTGSAQILLVEDEDAVRTFSARALGNKGYKVLEANGGDAALHLLTTQNPPLDLMVTDVVMPGMDGPTLAREVRALYPKIKIIFISGYTEDKFKDHLGEDIFFLPKPFSLKQLASKVKEVLEQ
jgi:two-component system cell cycle sensor histidine kinase/response regulator CckA